MTLLLPGRAARHYRAVLPPHKRRFGNYHQSGLRTCWESIRRRYGHSALALTGLVLGLGLTGTGLAYVLYYYIVQRMGAVQASTVTYPSPVVAMLIGRLLVRERLRAMDLIAMSAILCGVYAIQTSGVRGRVAAGIQGLGESSASLTL